MTPEHFDSSVDSALNGDEPTAARQTVETEPNGSEEASAQQPPEPEIPQDEPEASTEPDAAPPAAEPEPEPEPETEPEPEPEPEVVAPAEPEAVAPAEAEPEPQEPEAVAEPEAPAASAEPEKPVSAEPASTDAAEQEDASSIAAEIERALAAAATASAASAAQAERTAAELETPLAAAPEPAEPEEDEDGRPVAREWQPGEWFVVHTYAGYENKVKTNLESRISSMNMEEMIFEVVIPVEDVMEIKSGKKQVVQRKVFPGYLLVRMDLDDHSWSVVRNTPGVTGFVGSGSKPIPLSEKEVDRILQRKPVGERPKPKLEWALNDPVRVTTGPFANFQGLISEIDTDRSKLKVLVNIFGRETPVELGFDQVAKV